MCRLPERALIWGGDITDIRNISIGLSRARLLLPAPSGVAAAVPVSVDVRGAEGVAVVQQRGVDQHVVLRVVHQVLQVAQVAVAASHAVAGAVLVQDEHLAGTEPTLETHTDTQTQTIGASGGGGEEVRRVPDVLQSASSRSRLWLNLAKCFLTLSRDRFDAADAN